MKSNEGKVLIDGKWLDPLSGETLPAIMGKESLEQKDAVIIMGIFTERSGK